MKKIINPWQGVDGYHCYGCDPDHACGLRMEFYEDGEEVVCRWRPRPVYQGWVNTLHGGIQATLADEISSWVVFRKFQTSGVTSKMEVRYLRPVRTTDAWIDLRARVGEQRRNLVRIDVRIANPDGELCTQASCTYFLFPKERARTDFHFSGCDVEETDSLPAPSGEA